MKIDLTSGIGTGLDIDESFEETEMSMPVYIEFDGVTFGIEQFRAYVRDLQEANRRGVDTADERDGLREQVTSLTKQLWNKETRIQKLQLRVSEEHPYSFEVNDEVDLGYEATITDLKAKIASLEARLSSSDEYRQKYLEYWVQSNAKLDEIDQIINPEDYEED